MSAQRIVAPAMIAALGLAGLSAAASAAPSADTATASRAAVDQCRLRVQKVRVKDLQHDVTGTDQVFARIGNSFTTTRSYVLPQTRNTVSDGEELFSVSAPLTLQVDFGGGSIAVGSAVLPCQNSNPDFVFDNGDARYKVRALVQVLP